MNHGHLKPAVDYFGSQSAIARKFGLKKSRVNHWTRRGVPASWAIKIEIETKGAVTHRQLVPNLFNGDGA